MKKPDLAQIKTKPSLVNMEEGEIKEVEDLHTRAKDLNTTQVAEITAATTTITMAITIDRNSNLKNQIKKNTSDEEVIVCQICHKRKHSAAECWNRYDTDNEEDLQALAAMNHQDNSDQQFYVDSGATSHMTNNTGNLDHVKPYRGNDKIIVGNGQDLNILHIGSAYLNTNHGTLHLNNILVVQKLKKSLLSIGQLIDDIKCVFEFNTNGFIVKSKENKVLAKGSKQGKLYTLEGDFLLPLTQLKENLAFLVYGTRCLAMPILNS